MKILYKQNPLETVVELDEKEKEILSLKYAVDDLENKLFEIGYYLRGFNDDKTVNVEHLDRAISAALRWSSEEGESKRAKHIEEMTNMLISELKRDHCGDCTCNPFSCTKCFAESLLGIDTTAGLGKQEAANIAGAFRVEGVTTCQEAIDYLEKWRPKTTEWTAIHAARWEQERLNAIAWLKNYQENILTFNLRNSILKIIEDGGNEGIKSWVLIVKLEALPDFPGILSHNDIRSEVTNMLDEAIIEYTSDRHLKMR